MTTILIYGTVSFALWIIIGVIAVKCEIKWGLPFACVSLLYDEKSRIIFTKRAMAGDIFKNILIGPLMFARAALFTLFFYAFFLVWLVWEYIFVLPGRKMANFFLANALSSLMFSWIIIIIIMIIIVAYAL